MSIFRFHKNKDKDNENNIPETEAANEIIDVDSEPDPDEIDEPEYDEEAAYDSSPILSDDSDMEEIYSTKDNQVKYRRIKPLEAEAEAKRKEAAKDDLKRGKLQFVSTDDEDAPEVKLEAELDPDAIVADEIIEDVVDVKKLRNIYVQDIDDIDVSLDPMDSVKAY